MSPASMVHSLWVWVFPSAWSLGVCAVGGPSVRGLAKWGGEESHWVIPSVHRVSGAGI